jgi:TolB-like protein/Flp pilus assembly protein TadD
VLPFAARSATESEETDFFAEGMHDDLLTQLSKIEGLTVISRTSVMQFRETEMAIPEIAGELGVATVLEGAVDRAGDRIRVNVQLIEAVTDRHLWAETYDEAFTAANVFSIRADLSRKIAAALHATLSPSVDAELESAPTESLEAYDLYSRGRFVLSTRGATREGVESAIELHRRAIDVDPEYAPALDPNLADAHVADAHLLNAEFRRAEARRAVERALELSPGNARALSLYSSVLLDEADMAGSVATARRAVEIDPLSVAIRRSLVARLAWAGSHEETILEAERLLELDPREADGHYYIGVALDGQGRFEDAIGAYERAIEINPEDPYYPAAVAYSHAMLGNREEAVLAAEQALAAGVPLKELALVYSAMGDMDTAFEWLARAAETEPGTLSTLDADPTSGALRGDPRYEEIMAPLRSN